MDWHYAFDAVLGIASVAVGWIMKMFNDRLKTVEDDHKELPNVYARRDDVKDMKGEILEYLRRIEDKVTNQNG